MNYLTSVLAATLFFSSTALAADIFEPIAGNGNQKASQSILLEKQKSITVSVQHMTKTQEATVFHPNGGGKISDTFSPYDYRNIVNANVFYLKVENNSGQTIGGNQLQLKISLNGLPYEYLSTKELTKKWRKYYYLNTNTITGAPNFLEQERAITAEKHISKHGFQAQDIPPGGSVSGLIAVPYVKETGTLKFRVRNLGRGYQDFVFRFHAKNKS